MDYFRLLNFHTEPFSNSPDPEFFFGSPNHLNCLQKLEISIRLRRGLCVVMGEVGAGKTTICRKLLRNLKDDPDIEAHLILDPAFFSPMEMLGALNRMMTSPDPSMRLPSTESGYKELIKNHLFEKAVRDKKNVVLILDEGQKISSSCLEVLRELLNYETNEHKLLQIIIFAQNEFQDILDRHANFTDRISLLYRLQPLSLRDTRDFIRFRIEQATDYTISRHPGVSFTSGAYIMIHRITGGHPRKVINLCHSLLLLLLVVNTQKATASLVRRAGRSLPGARTNFFILRPVFSGVAAAMLFFALVLGGGYLLYPRLDVFSQTGQDLSHDPPAARTAAPELEKYLLSPGPEVEVTPAPMPVESVKLAEEVQYFPAPDAGEDNSLPDVRQIVIPEEIGRIMVRPGENLWNIMRRIYGEPSPFVARQVLESNPHIKDINQVKAGQTIILPVTSARAPAPDEACWIVLETQPNLKKAYAGLMNIDNRSLRILTHIDANQEIHYSVAWPQGFPTEQKAGEEMKNLPGHIRQSAYVLRLSEDSILLL